MSYKDKKDAIRYNNNYNKDNYDRISLIVPKGKREIIRYTAEQLGESANTFINRAIDKELERVSKNVTGGSSDLLSGKQTGIE